MRGHFFWREDTWLFKLGATHEINIGAETLGRPIEEASAALLHEMCHPYCYENSVKDTSQDCTYPNKRFKATVKSHGLIVEHQKNMAGALPISQTLCWILFWRLGWRISLSFATNTMAFPVLKPIAIAESGLTLPKKFSSRKYICHYCKNSVRAA